MMTRWIPFEKERPPSILMEYDTIASHGTQEKLQWDGVGWNRKAEADGRKWYERVYYDIAFWRHP